MDAPSVCLNQDRIKVIRSRWRLQEQTVIGCTHSLVFRRRLKLFLCSNWINKLTSGQLLSLNVSQFGCWFCRVVVSYDLRTISCCPCLCAVKGCERNGPAVAATNLLYRCVGVHACSCLRNTGRSVLFTLDGPAALLLLLHAAADDAGALWRVLCRVYSSVSSSHLYRIVFSPTITAVFSDSSARCRHGRYTRETIRSLCEWMRCNVYRDMTTASLTCREDATENWRKTLRKQTCDQHELTASEKITRHLWLLYYS